jgi:hypothetical protein
VRRGPFGIRLLTVAVCALAGAALLPAAFPVGRAEHVVGSDPPPATPVVPAPATTPPAAPAPAALPVIDYWTAPRGFPADPAPLSTATVTEALHPLRTLAVYDAPGGRPRARLRPSISAMPFTAPIVARSTGWVAVLLPSVNRRVGWLPAGGWVVRPLRDQLVVRRRAHQLVWMRDGVRRAAWRVATGTAATPTPPGRTFVLGRTPTSGAVYGGLDALALGSVPDDRRSVPAALRRAHTGIHSWYRADAFGRSTSNGCVRTPRDGQRTLLKHIAPGTAVTVVD